MHRIGDDELLGERALTCLASSHRYGYAPSSVPRPSRCSSSSTPGRANALGRHGGRNHYAAVVTAAQLHAAYARGDALSGEEMVITSPAGGWAAFVAREVHAVLDT
jgi:hypothetical protein